MKRILQVYGIYNSGTNYITWLLRNNFTIPVSRERKHDGPHTPNGQHYDKEHEEDFQRMIEHDKIDNVSSDFLYPDEVYFVFIIRSPRTTRREGRDSCNINSWNMYNRKHYDFYLKNKHRAYYVRYEDLLGTESRNKILDEIRVKFGLEKKHEEYVNLEIHAHSLFNEAKNVKFNIASNRRDEGIKGADPNLLKAFGYS